MGQNNVYAFLEEHTRQRICILEYKAKTTYTTLSIRLNFNVFSYEFWTLSAMWYTLFFLRTPAYCRQTYVNEILFPLSLYTRETQISFLIPACILIKNLKISTNVLEGKNWTERCCAEKKVKSVSWYPSVFTLEASLLSFVIKIWLVCFDLFCDCFRA